MTRLETQTLGDALARLRTWQRNRENELVRTRRRAEMWEHRAKAQAARATQAEREVYRLRKLLRRAA